MGVVLLAAAPAKPPPLSSARGQRVAGDPAAQAGPRVLNLGCGDDGYGTHRVDFTPSPVVTQLASALQLPFRDASFDEVFAANILEHMVNPMALVSEAVRVLRPGGRLVLLTDHAGYLGYHFIGLRPGDNHQWHGAHGDRHYMLFTPGHLRNLCETAGLEVEDVQMFTKWRQGLGARLLRVVARPLAMANLRVVAVKPVDRSQAA